MPSIIESLACSSTWNDQNIRPKYIVNLNVPNSVELGQSWTGVILQLIFAFWDVIPNELDTRNTLIRSSINIRIEQKTIETLISILKSVKPKTQISDSCEEYGLCVRTQAHTGMMV